jgi:hypothetical protein
MSKFHLFAAALVFIAAFTVSTLANPTIMQKHAGKKKDGKAINCMYCHGNNANKLIEKRGGQNMAQLKQRPGCKGPGCH